MKRYRYTIVFIVCLLSFTVYVLLDTFVISRPMRYAKDQINYSMFLQNQTDISSAETDTWSEKAEDIEDNTNRNNDEKNDSDWQDTALSQGGTLIGEYQNDQAAIRLYQYEYLDTTVYAAEVTVTSSEAVKTAFAKGYYGKNVKETTSSMAEQNNAILAINGDFYGAREKGYVIRNGVVFRETSDGSDLMCLYADGQMCIVDSDEISAQALVEEGVWQAFCFGPALLQNGEISVSEKEEVGKAMASNPRTAIGMIDSCHYVFVVSDGRTTESQGLSLHELAAFMQELGIETAYNLDGGGSSTLYFDGEVINYPTTSGRSMKERGVSDIVYIGK